MTPVSNPIRFILPVVTIGGVILVVTCFVAGTWSRHKDTMEIESSPVTGRYVQGGRVGCVVLS